MSKDQVPKEVIAAFEKAYPDAKIEEVEKLMKPDNTLTGYEVEIKAAGRETELEWMLMAIF